MLPLAMPLPPYSTGTQRARSLGVFTRGSSKGPGATVRPASCTSTLTVSASMVSFLGIGFRVRFCLKTQCHCRFICLFKFGNPGPALVPWFTEEETETQRWQVPEVPLCKSGPEQGPELGPGGPAWEAARWVCQGLPPAPLGSAQGRANCSLSHHRLRPSSCLFG